MRSLGLLSVIALFALTASAQELPREWVDPDTGHRVVRLSDEPGSASLYFHQNAYTPDGSKLIFAGPRSCIHDTVRPRGRATADELAWA